MWYYSTNLQSALFLHILLSGLPSWDCGSTHWWFNSLWYWQYSPVKGSTFVGANRGYVHLHLNDLLRWNLTFLHKWILLELDISYKYPEYPKRSKLWFLFYFLWIILAIILNTITKILEKQQITCTLIRHFVHNHKLNKFLRWLIYCRPERGIHN